MSFACFEAVPDMPPVDEIVAYLKQLSRPTMSERLAEADRSGIALIQPRSGVGSQRKMIALLDVLNRPDTADCLTLTIDSHTRLLKFDTAKRLLMQAPEQLNGYPLVAHGYQAVREITERYDRPIQVRHGSPDGRRLFVESIAGGIQSFEGGGISYNLPYCRNVSLELSLRAWQEIDQACGGLEELGCPIDREFFGSLSAVLMPPSISLAVILLEAVLASRAGCRCLSLAYPQSGNIIQDVAAMQSIRQLATRYVDASAKVYPVLHEFMGVFPQDIERAQTLILFGGLTGRLGRATKIINKTSQEAIGIPDAEVNDEGIRRTRLAYEDYFSFLDVPRDRVDEEAYWIQRETQELLDPILSKPDLITAIVEAFHDGRLDIPFPSNRREALGRIAPVRDSGIAIRFADTGKLPFSDEVKAHNKAKCKQSAPDASIFKRVRDSIMYFA